METYHVDKAKYGDRLDHICAIGRVKRRVEIMHSLPGNPLVLVLNLQIPGDPPASICSYFLVPPSFYPGPEAGFLSDRSVKGNCKLDKTRELFKKFVDVPFTPQPVESEEYLAQCRADEEIRATKLAAAAARNSNDDNSNSDDLDEDNTGDNNDDDVDDEDADGPARLQSVHYVTPAPRSWTR